MEYGVLIFGMMVAVTFFLVRRASRKYEREHIANGTWDEQGPLHPTYPKPWEIVSRRSLGLRLRDRDEDSEQDDEAARRS